VTGSQQFGPPDRRDLRQPPEQPAHDRGGSPPIWVNFSVSENENVQIPGHAGQGLLRAPKYEEHQVEIILVERLGLPLHREDDLRRTLLQRTDGTFLIRATFDNPQGVLRPNQYVRARLKGSVRPNAILVLRGPCSRVPGATFVWVVGKESKVEVRTRGGWGVAGRRLVHRRGVESGELVVVDGALTLRPGMTVSKTAWCRPGLGSAGK